MNDSSQESYATVEDLRALIAELQKGERALTPRSAALFAAHLCFERGLAQAARLTRSEIQSEAARYAMTYPHIWGALLVGDIRRFVRLLDFNAIEHGSDTQYQHTMALLLAA